MRGGERKGVLCVCVCMCVCACVCFVFYFLFLIFSFYIFQTIFSVMLLKLTCVLFIIFQRFLDSFTTFGIMLFVTLFNGFWPWTNDQEIPSWILWRSCSSLYIRFRKFLILYIFFSSINFINFLCNIIFINIFCIFVFL